MSIFDRRRFLRTSLVLPATILLGGTALKGNDVSNTNKNRPFEILVLGDSIMWGQGLLENEKFYNIVKNWLQKDVLKEQRLINPPWVEAHSGATIFPETDASRNSLKKFSSGETNVSSPCILYQVENALDHYKKTLIPRESVDLILVDGGINDLTVERLFKVNMTDEKIKHYAQEFCGYGMKLLLKSISLSFPNAKIVVTGYYPIISKLTSHLMLGELLWGMFGINPPNVLLDIPFSQNHRLRNALARRCTLWANEANINLQKAVNTINEDFSHTSPSGAKNPRVFFVPIKFQEKHSYAAGEETYLWKVEQRLKTDDHMFQSRKTSCEVDGKRGIDDLICRRAGTAHPNVNGAVAYAEAIIDKLSKEIVPNASWI
jgi:lysophospholipase L1-like esterase